MTTASGIQIVLHQPAYLPAFRAADQGLARSKNAFGARVPVWTHVQSLDVIRIGD